MARDQRPAEELSIEELEALLARKKVEARRERLRQFERSGRTLRVPPGLELTATNSSVPDLVESRDTEVGAPPPNTSRAGKRSTFSRVLLAIEILAVLGLAFVLFSGVEAWQQLNREVTDMISGVAAEPTPLITAVVLPSGHTPPTSPGGARPNDAEIPENLRPLVQSLPAVAIPTVGPEQARSIHIPALWNTAAPVVQGDGWEQLKRGVGQHIGSANPGQNGNMVLSAHNDIFGELFRDLDQLKPGDEIQIQTATQNYLYRVTGISIVEPTEVSVMNPTPKPTLTLISCYPYMVDNQRIVVFGELVGG